MVIRLASSEDAPAVARIYGPIVRDTVISFEVDPPSELEMERRIAATLGHAPWLVSEENGEILGYVYASKHRERAAYQWSVDVAAYTHDAHRRKRVGRALYTTLFELLRLQGFRAAHAGITLPNAASVGFHEALGFRAVGVYSAVGFKLGAWHDVGWWQLRLIDSRDPPRPLIPLRAAQALPEWKSTFEAANRQG